jgi:hypothetical protein
MGLKSNLRLITLACAAVAVSVGSLALRHAAHTGKTQPNRRSNRALPDRPKQIKIDLDRAVDVPIPEIEQDLTPADFKTPDGRAG